MRMNLCETKEDEEEQVPVVSIQCDWDETLLTPGSQIWTSYKFKDRVSVEGKVNSISDNTSGRLKLVSTDGFNARLINQSTLELDLPRLKHRATLVAPSFQFSDIHTTSIRCFDVTSKGVIVSASSDNKLIVWNSDKQGHQFRLELEGHTGEVYKCKFFPSEKVILSCGSDMSLRIWCAITGRCPVRLVGHTQSVTDCSIIDRGRNVLSASKDGSCKLWHCGEGECLGDVICVPSPINCCLVCDAPQCLNLPAANRTPGSKEVGTGGKIVVAGCEDGRIYCAGLESRQILFSLINTESAVNSVIMLPDCNFVTASQDGRVITYEICEDKAIMKRRIHNTNSAALSLLALSDTEYIVCHADGGVTLSPTCDTGVTLSLHLTGCDCDPVYHIAANSRYVFTSSRDATIRAYDRTHLTNLVKHK